ncbi:MAG: hypothetical protein EOO11_23315 [Chitinophagaceae bacterium]|nr:MAG: hypothetical protein EOO11_23315 [Chitinophagaceae bacterium]
MPKRPLRPEERALIEALLAKVAGGKKYSIPEEAGALGDSGLQLSDEGEHAEDLVEATFMDDDRRAVYLTLTANDKGALYELDIWKVDFSPLKRYPAPGELRFDD